MTYLIVLIVAFCSIVYELLMAQTLAVLLGNTVMRYSITVGVYLAALGVGAMLCKKGGEETADRLMRVELALSVIGGCSVIGLSCFDVLHRYVFTAESLAALGGAPWLVQGVFLFLAHGIIVAIGIFSGFEVPLLIEMRRRELAAAAVASEGVDGDEDEPRQERALNMILGVDYFGSLLGAVLFPILFLRTLGLFATAFVVALLNVVACILLLTTKSVRRKGLYGWATALVGVALLAALAYTPAIEQFFLKKFYYYDEVKTLTSLVDGFTDKPPIETYRSPYQRIDFVWSLEPEESMVPDLWSTKFHFQPDYPRGLYLVLNGMFQFFSTSEDTYHEFFVHVPIQWCGIPKRVLVLGGGDGLVARELLKYDAIGEIVQVELDPMMASLARTHKDLRRMNEGSLESPRVRLVLADAFTWLRSCRRKFDAIYIDFPVPVDYDLSRLYSKEFYSMVRRCLASGGYAVADMPGAEEELWPVYGSTLRAAGFRGIRHIDVALELRNAIIEEAEKGFLQGEAREKVDKRGKGATVTPADIEASRKLFRKVIAAEADNVRQRFVFFRARKGPVNQHFRDDGVPFHVMNAERLALAAQRPIDTVFRPALVNSVLRPTLPPLDLFSASYPY